jgi:peptide-methionine (S)-S-oxide reductase
VNGNVAAAEHLVARGAKPTFATALCLGHWDDVTRLAPTTSERDKQLALVLAALNGRAEALRRVIALGADVNRPSKDLYAHGTPLHHAVCSGSLEAVRVLVAAGAGINTKDSAWNGTPLGWAEHYKSESERDARRNAQYVEIAAYLRSKGGVAD